MIRPSGRVHAKAARVVSFRSRAKAWRARHPGTSAPGGMISPRAANTTAFNGISQHDCTASGCVPLPVAATGPNGAQITEGDDQFIKVFDKTGAALCGGGMTLNAFFGGTGIRFPQMQYDDVSNQFVVEAAKESGTSTATIYLAATTGHNACGHWHIYTITVGGPGDSVGGVFSAGQDARAVLLSLPVEGPEGLRSILVAIPKAQIFAGTPLTTASFTLPTGADSPTPVTVAGSPTINSPSTYFLATNETLASGYVLYTMTGSGSATPTLTSQPVGGPFPSDRGFEDFISNAVFDGSRIWFGHGVGSPAQDGSSLWRYGYIKVADKSFTTADLGTTGGPLELNGSIAVSPNADGTVSVFLAWMSADKNTRTQAAGFVKSFIYPGSGPLPGTASSDQNVAVSAGQPELETVTTASIDPGTANGTCAVTTHPNWLKDGTWTSLVRRTCGATPPVQMPSVTGESDTAAISAVQAAGLAASVTTIEPPTGDCSILTSETIVDQDPQPGTAVSAGATVSLTFCGFAF